MTTENPSPEEKERRRSRKTRGEQAKSKRRKKRSKKGRRENPVPACAIHVNAGNDKQGNPCDAFVIIDNDANLIEVRNDGQDLPCFELETTPVQFKQLLEIGARSDNPGWKSWAEEQPALATAAGAGIGAVAGTIVGLAIGMPGLGSISGGAVGGYMGAPDDRKNRGAWGGGIGGAFTPVGAAIGGAIGGRKPSAKASNPSIKQLKSKLLR